MRHRVKTKKLNRDKAHREALLRNLARSLILKKSIVTTTAKAKVTKSFAERLVTIARKNAINARRRVFNLLGDKKVVKTFFDELIPELENRTSGTIRIVKLGKRKGDGADMSLVEFIVAEKKEEKKKEKKKKEKRRRTRIRRTAAKKEEKQTKKGVKPQKEKKAEEKKEKVEKKKTTKRETTKKKAK
ncbi:MAG: 50S ribosomal protein L17 [Candidatus Cloacimonas sp. 4484_209]|nr:MAG: 50S ribosomal protein L17 [Candidatus Cloacimonas sp. 4484_209]